MAWIEVHQSLLRHRKTLRLATELHANRHRTVGLLIDLWCWALDNASDGDLSHITDDALSRALEWHGPPLKKALKAAQFLDGDTRIHDWDTYVGRLMDRRIDHRIQMREWRARRQGKLRLVEADRAAGSHHPVSTT